MNALRRLGAIVMKELAQLKRDHLTFAMIVGIPTMQLLLFGYAINMDVRHIDAVVVDEAGTQSSRAVVEQMARTQVMDVAAVLPGTNGIDALLRRGDASLAIVIPRDYERRLQSRDEAAMQLVVDGSDTVVMQAARQLAAMPLGDGSEVALAAPSTPARAERTSAPPTGRIEVLNLYNPERRSAFNIVPGLIGVILTMTMVMFTAVAIVRERERGNLEFLIATPVRPVELVAGKVLPFVLIGLVQVTVVLALGTAVFGVPIRGSLVDVYGIALTYITAALALGVFISTLAKTQFQAMQMAFFSFLPQILLSGFMFPFAGMPKPAQWLAEILPLTHFIRMIRGVMLRDATLFELHREWWALVAFAAIALTIAVLRFRKKLD